MFVQIVAQGPGGPGFESQKYVENAKKKPALFQNHLDHMLEFLFVVFPSGSLPSLFK